LPLARQARVLRLSRSSVYYRPLPMSSSELALMAAIDEIHTKLPFYGIRRIRGDVVALTDASGSAFAAYRYDAWGNSTASSSAATGSITATLAAAIASRQPLRYAGYAWDATTGLYYCSQRHYDPTTAAWLTRDPARADGEESAYQYCGGDPAGKVDPSGMATTWYALTSAEKLLAMQFPVDAYGVNRAKHDAEASTSQFYSQGVRDNNADAFRHAYWNILMRKRLGWWTAYAFATAHETNAGQPALVKAMDLNNNAVGRNYFKSHSSSSDSGLACGLRTWVRNGVLRRMVNDRGVAQTRLIKTSRWGER
jgi:RHS repeat-associated protein